MPVPDFSPGEVLTAAAMDSIGLWLISTTTIGTGVSSVTVTNAFSANYNNYRIVINGGVVSTGSNMTLQLTSITGSVYNTGGSFVSFGSAVLTGFGPAAATNFIYGPGDTNLHSAVIDVINPFTAVRKAMVSNGVSGGAQYSLSCFVNSTTSSTGFTIGPTAGFGTTITGGTIRVYGYRN